MKLVIKKSKFKQKKIALERIKVLFNEAEKRPVFAKRYMVLAKKLKTRYKVRFPKELARKTCKKCCAFFVYGKNCRIRTKNNNVVCSCLECGFVSRFPLLRRLKKLVERKSS